MSGISAKEAAIYEKQLELQARAEKAEARVAELEKVRDHWQGRTAKEEATRIELATELEHAQAERDRIAARVAELTDLMGWAAERLHEINPSNYDHDDVLELNDKSVEVALALADALSSDSRAEAMVAVIAGAREVAGSCVFYGPEETPDGEIEVLTGDHTLIKIFKLYELLRALDAKGGS